MAILPCQKPCFMPFESSSWLTLQTQDFSPRALSSRSMFKEHLPKRSPHDAFADLLGLVLEVRLMKAPSSLAQLEGSSIVSHPPFHDVGLRSRSVPGSRCHCALPNAPGTRPARHRNGAPYGRRLDQVKPRLAWDAYRSARSFTQQVSSKILAIQRFEEEVMLPDLRIRQAAALGLPERHDLIQQIQGLRRKTATLHLLC